MEIRLILWADFLDIASEMCYKHILGE